MSASGPSGPLVFYSICKSFSKTNIFVTLFGKLTINLTFMLYTEFTCLCVVKHVIHTMKASKHEESTVLMDISQQVLCTMQLVINLNSYPYFVEAGNLN